MAASNIREQVITRLDKMTDAQVVELLRYIEAMQSDRLPEDYDEANDPTIGILSGPTDLAERTEEILLAEFGRRKPPEDDDK